MRRGAGATFWRVIALLAALALLVLALAQLLLPKIAASTISSRVGRYGRVRSVSVSAWPAVRLLWGSADAVTVRADSLALTPAQSAKLLWEARDVARMDVSAASVREGPLQLRAARMRKRGDQLSGEAKASAADVARALPPGMQLRLLASGGGQVRVLAGGGLFGLGASVEAVAGASEGALVARPTGVLLGGLRVTLLADPHVYVEGVGAERTGTDGYKLTMRARLR